MNRTELEQALKPLGFTFEDGPEWCEGPSFYIRHPRNPDWCDQITGLGEYDTPDNIMVSLINETVQKAEDRAMRW
jgi:hypothetical protein